MKNNEFDFLYYVYKNGLDGYRKIAQSTNISLGVISKLANKFKEIEALDEKGLTPKGIELLKPYKVDGALIIAAGFTGPEKQIQEAFEAEFSKDSYQTNIENVFACGDCRTGQSLVVKAMVDGQKCAEAVEKYLAK